MNADRLTRRRFLCAASITAMATRAPAQGFAGLGRASEDYAMPRRGEPLRFPADHGPHPRFRIEWWYLTANLRDADGTDYGIQWTLFRSALRPDDAGTGAWRSAQAWLGHAALTTPELHRADERFARGDIGQAGVTVTPFEARIDDWSLSGPDFDRLDLRAAGPDFGYELALTAEGPLVFHGDDGFSVKSAAGQASRYYSQPFYRAEGVLRLPDREIAVTGRAWLDREWSSQPLAADQEGWDWFSLHLEGGAKLMGFQLRSESGPAFTAATHIAPDGTTEAFPDGAFSVEPLATAEVAGRDIPVRWRIALPARGIDGTVEALNPDAWNGLAFPYWEGPVRLSGSHDGIGYLEMTGYE